MLFFTFLLFILFSMAFLKSISNLLSSLIILELLGFCLLWGLLSSSVVAWKSVMLVIIFCIFVLESVVGLLGLLNFLGSFGNDYLFFSMCIQ